MQRSTCKYVLEYMENRDGTAHGVRTSQGKGLPLLQHRARTLRLNQTEAEKRLWKVLRAGRVEGLKFRRQFPVAEFIADFCCKEKMLIVEVDGDSHAEQVAYDSWRTQMLERRGYRVIRFWNQEVMTNLDGVIEAILMAARSTTP